jgi:hypothetical protein
MVERAIPVAASKLRMLSFRAAFPAASTMPLPVRSAVKYAAPMSAVASAASDSAAKSRPYAAFAAAMESSAPTIVGAKTAASDAASGAGAPVVEVDVMIQNSEREHESGLHNATRYADHITLRSVVKS